MNANFLRFAQPLPADIVQKSVNDLLSSRRCAVLCRRSSSRKLVVGTSEETTPSPSVTTLNFEFLNGTNELKNPPNGDLELPLLQLLYSLPFLSLLTPLLFVKIGLRLTLHFQLKQSSYADEPAQKRSDHPPLVKSVANRTLRVHRRLQRQFLSILTYRSSLRRSK